MASFTYSWAEELQAQGVRVNAVSPLAATRLNDATRAYYGALGQEVPYIEPPPPEWNAPLVSFLLSDAAAGVTGQVVRLENHNLGLMTHPAVSLPLVRGERWDFDDVAARPGDHDRLARERPPRAHPRHLLRPVPRVHVRHHRSLLAPRSLIASRGGSDTGASKTNCKAA